MRFPLLLLLAAALGVIAGAALMYVVLTPSTPSVVVNVEPAPVLIDVPPQGSPSPPARVQVGTSGSAPIAYTPASLRRTFGAPLPESPPVPPAEISEAPTAAPDASDVNVNINSNAITLGGAVSLITITSPKELAHEPALAKAFAFAREAADPYFHSGFAIRDFAWAGYLQPRTSKAIEWTLYEGYDYWFWMGTSQANSIIAVHLYGPDGQLAESESWQHSHAAGAHIKPKHTGNYNIIVAHLTPQRAVNDATRDWALLYGFR